MLVPEGKICNGVGRDGRMMETCRRSPESGRRPCAGGGTAAMFLIPILLCLLLLVPAASAADIETALGEIVHLSGYSYESTVVYLFLTGPNLPASGVALDDLSLPANQGGGTRVTVDDKHHWKYDWNTHMSGGSIDEGSYTVWISSEPADRQHLRSGEYRTLSVLLTSPSVSAGSSTLAGSSTTPQAGAVSIRSVPAGASVRFNGQYKGITPLTIDPVDPGTYEAALSLDNYHPVSTEVTVESGSLSEVNVTLFPYIGSLSVATTPPGADILLDGTQAGISPLSLSAVPAGNHTVTARLSGYADATATVSVPAGGKADAVLTLTGSGGAGTIPMRSGIAAPLAFLPALVVAVLLAVRAISRRRT